MSKSENKKSTRAENLDSQDAAKIDNENVKPARRHTGVPVAQRRRARKLLVQALYQWIMSGTDVLEIELQFRLEHEGKIEWSFFNEILTAIPGELDRLDSLITPLLDRDISALDPVEKGLLYLGCFELANRIDVPYRVVINEYVELAKVFGATDGHKYINSVLDKLALELRALETAQ